MCSCTKSVSFAPVYECTVLSAPFERVDLREGGALVATRAGTDSAYPVEPVPERIDAESLAWLGPAYWYSGSVCTLFGMACGNHGSCAFIGGRASAHKAKVVPFSPRPNLFCWPRQDRHRARRVSTLRPNMDAQTQSGLKTQTEFRQLSIYHEVAFQPIRPVCPTLHCSR